MFSLVIKDILIQKKNLISVLIYPLIGIFAFGYSFSIDAAYVFSIISIGYIMIQTAGGYDEKNKFDIVLNSLPVKRDDAVIAKYMSVIVFFILGVILAGVEGLIIKSAGIVSYVEAITLSDVLAGACALCLYYALYFPLNFKFGTIKMKFINMLIYMFFIFVPMFIVSAIKQNPDNVYIQAVIRFLKSMSSAGIKSIGAAAALLLFILSMYISIGIYNRKDF